MASSRREAACFRRVSGHIAFVWYFRARSQRVAAIDFVRSALWVARCGFGQSGLFRGGLGFGFSRYNPVEFRLTRNAHPARAHAHHARATSLLPQFVVLALREIIPGQKFLHLERSRLAFASCADQQFKHLDDAAQSSRSRRCRGRRLLLGLRTPARYARPPCKY